ncbi:MAG TPA: hypothetical protein VMF64_15360 [Steroidobacteraceae bacterium]|nr:hypothetical protein [Steroidobacteraceae bacterium]
MRFHLALLTAAVVLALVGCGGNPEVTLAQLAQSQQDYAGQAVLTRGVVRHERDPDGSDYFVLADPHGTLVGLDPSQKARPFEGRLVHVSGVFEVKPGFGRVIHIVNISLVLDAPR